MNKSQILEKCKALIPYFFLAAAIIVFFRLSGSLGVFGGAVAWVWMVISPFFWGFVLAYIINIPCGSIQRLLARSKNKFILRKQRMLSVLIVIVLILGLISLALSFIIPAAINSILLFASNWAVYLEGVERIIDDINSWEIFYISIDNVSNFFSDMFDDFTIGDIAAPINAIIEGIASVAGSVVSGVIAVISSIYILIEKDKLKASATKFFRLIPPEGVFLAITETTGRLNKYFRQYVRTQTLDGLILGTIVTIALTILGSPFALLLGITLGILNYIPLFGSLVGTIIAIAMVMFTQGFTTGLIAAVVLIIIQQLDANVIQPRLMGSSFAFSPLLIIISITVGGAVAGVLGMIIAIPIAAIIKDIFGEITAYYEKKKFGESE